MDALCRIGSHVNIIKLLGTIDTDDGAIGLVLDRYDTDMLTEVITSGPFSNSRAASATWQVVSALAFVHAKRVVICDIKPENVLIRRSGGMEHIAIADLGLVHNGGVNIDSHVGTAAYLAPEALQKGVASTPRDMWALGALLFGVLSGRSAFDRGCSRETRKAIKYDSVPMQVLPCTVSDDARQLIASLLQKNPVDRPTAHELLEFDPFVIRGAPRVPLLEIN
jgi:serine/threonine protein kinase